MSTLCTIYYSPLLFTLLPMTTNLPIDGCCMFQFRMPLVGLIIECLIKRSACSATGQKRQIRCWEEGGRVKFDICLCSLCAMLLLQLVSGYAIKKGVI